jgi:bacillithiol biosynthesis cysteine-adding enzyme BshC
LGRAFSSSYFAGEATARPFLSFDFRDRADRERRTRAAAGRRASEALLEILRAQQAALAPAPNPARAAALDALAAGGAAVVATGQQVGLFLGPLYGFYKAASAVAVARALEAESGVRCVPLFWLQTEDHDFAEIASVSIATADSRTMRLALADDAGSAPRASVSGRRLGVSAATLVEQLAEALGPTAAAADTVKLLRRHYQPDRPIAAAFAGAMAELFADEGLLFFDPRDPRVAPLAAPIHRRAISTADDLARRLQDRSAALAAAGFDDQIPCRPDCALSFFHPDGPQGDRFRLARRSDASGTPGAWGLSGRDAVITPDALEAALAREPLRFSTSALLRPILQDSLLPTAAYVGGPAEVSYFAQLGPIYDAFELPPPLVVPRARFRCLDASTRRRLAALGIQPDDVGRPPTEILPRLAAAPAAGAPDPAALAATARGQILPLVDNLAAGAAAVAPTDRNLVRAAARTRATIARALERLTARAARTAALRDEVAVARLARLEAALCPGGVPQERAYGWPSLAGRIGPALLKRLVFERLSETGPFTTSLLDLRP